MTGWGLEGRRPVLLLIPSVVFILLVALPTEARRERLALHHTSVDLPGAPAALLSHDLDGDGRRDLVVMVAYTEWDQVGIEESVEMDDIDGLVEVLTIVPALTDRRELRIFLATGDGFRAAGDPLPLGPEVLSLALGPGALGVIALTDTGLSALRFEPATGRAHFEPIFTERPVLAGAATFLPRLGLVHPLRRPSAPGPDVLFPAAEGLAVLLAQDDGLAPAVASRLTLPYDDGGAASNRFYPLPQVRDVDGDHLPDLVVTHPDHGLAGVQVLRNLDAGRFDRPIEPLAQSPLGRTDSDGSDDSDTEDGDETAVYFGDLDGDGQAEWVTHRSLHAEDAGFRKEMRQAKQPPALLRFFRASPTLAPNPEPYHELEILGYALDGGEDGGNDGALPGGFQDLDGDGRRDLVTLTLDFSMMQAVRILATRRISIGLDFHVWCQRPDGGFEPVHGLDLSGKFRLDLDDLRLGQLSQFAGDFDGDGKADFVQLGRGRRVSIHRGRDGCRYPADGDLTLELAEAPLDLALVDVRDLDGDALADLVVIQPQRIEDSGVTPPIRLDLYLSGDTP